MHIALYAEGSVQSGLEDFLMKRTRDSVHGHTPFVRQQLKRFTRHVRNSGPDLTIILSCFHQMNKMGCEVW